MTEEERRIHTEEFKFLFQKANVAIGEDRQLYDYLLWTMFKVDDIREKSIEIRHMVMKMKTIITKLILTKEERSDYADE